MLMTDPLEAEVKKYIANGYRVTSRTEHSAQLIRPKTFSFGWAVFWFLFLGAGLLVYLLYYLAKKDSIVYLSVDAEGTVNTQGSGLGSGHVCENCGYVNVQPRAHCKRCRTTMISAVA